MDDVLVPPENLARREFLKLSGVALLALAVPTRWRRSALGLENELLGRVAFPTVDVFRAPSFASEKVKTLWRDDILTLEEALLGDKFPEHNRVWYAAKGLGYVHSSAIQPVRDIKNEPLSYVPYRGMLMEVTVPFVDAYWKPRKDAKLAYRFYYGTTYWVNGVSRDVKKRKWYRIYDDKWTYHYYAPAEAFRPVPLTEFTPISPQVPLEEKRIEVDLQRQWVLCYEGPDLVFSTKVSTGKYFEEEDYYWTPEGDFITFRKRPSRHMVAGNRATGYDLPGVPWVAYITENGVSFHGTYWHNDFGAPRSHGCVNMTPQAAKWLYRWTHPVVPAEEEEVWVRYGTFVRIFA